MASTSHRASLEPLTPALVGIGLLHVLGGMVLWIVLPMLPSKEDPKSKLPANLVWRTPADFVGESAPAELPGGTLEKGAASESSPPPGAVATPAKPSDKPAPASATATKAGHIVFTPAKSSDSGLSLAPTALSLVPSGSQAGLRQLPPDTLSMLQSSIGSSSGIEGGKAGLAAQILGAAPPSGLPSVTVLPQAQPSKPEAAPSPAPPPVQPGQGREANKYITLSAIVDAPAAPAKSTLSLLDIAKLNDLERARKASENITGLDAVESALQKTLMSAWGPPPIDQVPANQRRVGVELAVLKDGTITDALLVTPSGSEVLDASVRTALARVTKIPESLPASFRKERYAVRVNLQIE